ncbi:hypothetical protein TNCV_2811701 [Trichonephila clavipes]|nr:hypothetical protein TNCV_2811701 [Trichonephila clavipes]
MRKRNKCSKLYIPHRANARRKAFPPFVTSSKLCLGLSFKTALPQPVAIQIARTAETDDCIIPCPAHRHHHNSNFSPIQSGGTISSQTSTSKDSQIFYDVGRRINL